jgi:CRISPR type III-A-associated protein Csm2
MRPMQNPNPSGQPPRRDDHGPRRNRTDDDFRISLRQVFGNDYVRTILEPSPATYDQFLDQVKDFVRTKARSITTHQLRNIFSRVKRARTPHELSILRPQLAYVAGRSERDEMRELVILLDDLIREVNEERLKAFQSFYEAIIAYHKYFDPKGS